MNYATIIAGFVSALMIASVPMVQAQTPTATDTAKTSTSSATKTDQTIEDLKDRIANKVEEMRKKNHKAIAGVVTDTKDKVFVIKTSDDATYEIKIDDALTKMYLISGVAKKPIKEGEIEKGAYIIATGPLIEKTINANVIYQDEEYIVRRGKVVEVDTTNGQLKVVTSEKDNITLDLPAGFRASLMDPKTIELAPTTLSKIKEGDSINFVYKKSSVSKTNPNMYVPERILIIPQEYFGQ